MFTLVCGEDSVASWSALIEKKKKLTEKHIEVSEVAPRELEDAIRDGGAVSLFSQQIAYVTTGLVSYLKRKKVKPAEYFSQLYKNQEIIVLDWENGKSLYEMGLRKEVYIEEYKPSADIFTLLDLCIPGKRKEFLQYLNKVLSLQEEVFVYTMLHRHVRSLLVAATNPTKVAGAPFMVSRIKNQARKWETEKLIKLYEGLTRIDISRKTNASPYTVGQSLEILACYYL